MAGLDDGDNNRTAALAGAKAGCLTRLQGAGRDTANLAQLINGYEPVAAFSAGQTSSAVFWHPTGRGRGTWPGFVRAVAVAWLNSCTAVSTWTSPEAAGASRVSDGTTSTAAVTAAAVASVATAMIPARPRRAAFMPATSRARAAASWSADLSVAVRDHDLVMAVDSLVGQGDRETCKGQGVRAKAATMVVWRHRMLGKLPCVGVATSYLVERSAFERCSEDAAKWIESARVGHAPVRSPMCVQNLRGVSPVGPVV